MNNRQKIFVLWWLTISKKILKFFSNLLDKYFIDFIPYKTLSWRYHFSICPSTDMQSLMGSLLYLQKGIENSTYSFLFEDSSWDEICDIFTRDACSLLGLSVESPLSVRYWLFVIFPSTFTMLFKNVFPSFQISGELNTRWPRFKWFIICNTHWPFDKSYQQSFNYLWILIEIWKFYLLLSTY